MSIFFHYLSRETFQSRLAHFFPLQEQLTTLPAARDLEADNTQLRTEVAQLKSKVSDLGDADAARRRAEERAEALELRVRGFFSSTYQPLLFG